MDPEALGRIFEPYFSTKATGTGLGLTIARRNVELNGGSIEVRSERGTGTTVTLRLPVAG
jgi:two-component system sensor histidine kinase HydH